MLGLFLILPVFAVHAMHLKGGGDHTLVGIALGAYGLTQGVLQIPYGMASDRYGRKRIIILGLVLFALGSFIAAIGDDIYVIIAGRAIQGAGAISAPVMAFLADLTREQHRTKAMALVGSSIGLMFALSLVGSPILYRHIGMGGIFVLTGVLALIAIWVVVSVVPEEALVKIEAEEHVDPARELFAERADFLHVPRQFSAGHRKAGIGILARQKIQGDVVREGDFRQAAGERRENVVPRGAAGVAAAGRVDVVVRLVRVLHHFLHHRRTARRV